MVNHKSRKAKPGTSRQVTVLTQSEKESLRQEMAASMKWMQEEYQRIEQAKTPKK